MNLFGATTDVGDVEEVTNAFAGVEAGDWIRAGVIFLVSIALAITVRRVVGRIADERRSTALRPVAVIGSYLVGLFGFIQALGALGVPITPLVGAFGLAGFTIAFALQDIIANFAAGLLIQFRRPFRRGDEVESDDFIGTVNDIDARTVTITTPEGETVKLPSADVMKTPIINHTAVGHRRTTLNVSLAYDTDLDLAVKILEEATLVDGVFSTPAPKALVFNFNDSGIDIAVQFWHGPRIADRWEVRDRVARSLHRATKSHQLEIPFPQRVMHMADRTGDTLREDGNK